VLGPPEGKPLIKPFPCCLVCVACSRTSRRDIRRRCRTCCTASTRRGTPLKASCTLAFVHTCFVVNGSFTNKRNPFTSLYDPTKPSEIYTAESGSSLAFQLFYFSLSLTHGHKNMFMMLLDIQVGFRVLPVCTPCPPLE
jgi:hypothetical protein